LAGHITGAQGRDDDDPGARGFGVGHG
jgi:hypothetical protein